MDFIGGAAGGILALLGPGIPEAPEHFRRAAVALGETICAAAEPIGPAWAWTSIRASGADLGPRPLTGLSHGAAGLGLALVALFTATGREDFRDGARRAFAYEDGLFDERRGNWPDLRRHEADDRPRFAVAWCHGAPGIVLARLRALELDPEGAALYLPAARAGIATTVAALESLAADPESDASLCHGVTGLAEVVFLAGEILNEDDLRRRARDATLALLAQHGERGDWPSGAPSRGPNPSLFLGEAGIGHWLLRLHDPAAVPSVLLPGCRRQSADG